MKALKVEYLPDYDTPCSHCKATPTVTIYVGGKLEQHIELCGPCCWGEAETLDPTTWNEFIDAES